MEVRLCRWCGLPFEQTRIDSLFCNRNCAQRFHRAVEREANPLPVFKIKCRECGKEFETDDNRRKFCSKQCKKKLDNRKTREREKKKRQEERQKNPHFCLFCERQLPEDASPKQKFCSPICRYRFNNHGKVKAEYKACEFCGNEFIPRNSRQRFCSTACLGKAEISERRSTAHGKGFSGTVGARLPDLEKGLREKERAAKAAKMSYGKYQAMLYLREAQECRNYGAK